jgi:cytochrome c
MQIRSAAYASITAIAFSGAVSAQPIDERQAKAILGKADCLTCHAVDVRIVGPTYKEVAQKYKGDPKAPEVLFRKVREGGSGSFGLVGPHGELRMVKNPPSKISDEELKKVIAWILTL